MSSKPPLEVLEFGPFTLDGPGLRLLRDGAPVPLTPKAFDALARLLTVPGQVVTRAALVEDLWPDTFVEEANLTNTIWMVRRALGEHADWLETVPRRGYRFAGPVTPAVRPSLGNALAPGPRWQRGQSPAPVTVPPGRSSLAALALLAPLGVVVAALVWTLRLGPGAAAPEGKSPLPPPGVSAQAFAEYLRGRELYFSGINRPYPERGELLERAVRHYRAALGQAPEWAQPWAGIAQASHWMSEVDPPRLFAQARDAARAAIAIDDTVAEGHGALGYVLAAYFREPQQAELEFRRAIALDPDTRYRHGFAMLLTTLGRGEEAEAQYAEALRRDPTIATLQRNAAISLWMTRRYERAVAAFDAAGLRADPGKAWALLYLGRAADALAVLSEMRRNSPGAARSCMACTLVALGRTDEALAELSTLQQGGVYDLTELAQAATCLREFSIALDALDRAERATFHGSRLSTWTKHSIRCGRSLASRPCWRA